MALARERNVKIFDCFVKCYLVFKCLRENRLVLGLKALSKLKHQDSSLSGLEHDSSLRGAVNHPTM